MNAYFRLKTHPLLKFLAKKVFISTWNRPCFPDIEFLFLYKRIRAERTDPLYPLPLQSRFIRSAQGILRKLFSISTSIQGFAFFSFLFVTHLAYHATNGLISTISLSILFPFLSNLPFNLTTLIWQFAQFARKGLINSSWCAKYCHLRFRILFFNQRKTPQKLCRPQYFIRSVWQNITINT